MELLVANVDNVKFDIEVALEQQLGAQPLPFVGMDKSTAAICVFYVEGTCVKGPQCPFRHVRGDRTIVCKHWLRGLCKKGDQCEFLHEYDMTKMPECYFYTRFNACHNKECPFLHIDPESKVRPCPWYDRGFCRHGPTCRHRHVRKVLCLNYLAGFCPDGPECKFVHPQFELPQLDEIAKLSRKAGIICHICQEVGHKSYQCPKNPDLFQQQLPDSENMMGEGEEEEQMKEGESESNSNKIIDQSSQQTNRRGAYLIPGGGETQQQVQQMGQFIPGGPRPPRHHFQSQGYQPYQFHPRPLYPRQQHNRDPFNRQDSKERREGADAKDETSQHHSRRALEDVVCYKCGYKGHYANKCDKGHLAFLSNKGGGAPPPPPGGVPKDTT